MFKFKEKEEESPTIKYQEKYDIFEHRGILEALEAEMKPFKDTLYPFYELCQSKGWIRIMYRKEKDPRDSTIDFTVRHNTDDPSCRTAIDFTDYCARNKALDKRNAYLRRKQEEADKQRLFTNA